MPAELCDGESLDDLQNGYFIIQSEKGFRYGMDAVLLSGYASVRPGEKVLDMGTGTGILPILLAAKTPGESFTGLEIQEKSACMARRSVAYNGLQDRIQIVTGDIKEAAAVFGPASFDVVVSNPPYMTGNHGLLNAEQSRAIARHEVLCTLEDLVRETARVLTSRGRFYLVHRPFRLAEIISVLKAYHLEPKRMRLVYPYVDKEPNMVLLEACRGGNPRIQVEKPLIVYEKPGIYTDEIREIYGDGR